MPADDNKPQFHFHNSLLSDKHSVQTIKRDIANTILDFYVSMGGVLDRNYTDELDLDCLESLLFDRIKNNPLLTIPSIDIIYEMLNKIEKSQSFFLKQRTNIEKKDHFNAFWKHPTLSAEMPFIISSTQFWGNLAV